MIGDFNTDEFNVLAFDAPSFALSIPSETVISFSQIVAIAFVGNIIKFSQNVQLYTSVPASTVIKFSQEVYTTFVGNIIKFSQRIIDPEAVTFYSRNGWDLVITVGGYQIPQLWIQTNIKITKEENQATLASVQIRIPSDLNLTDIVQQFWGAPVTFDYYNQNGVFRLFTGIVDTPNVELLDITTIVLNCSNERDAIINNDIGFNGLVGIGRYALEAQGTFNRPTDYLNLVLKTIQVSADFDSYNNFSLNPWFAKASPDYTYTDSDIRFQQPKVIWQLRANIINSVTSTITYDYTRLYHMSRNFSWTYPWVDDPFIAMAFGYSLASVKMIEDAITGAKWKYENLDFTSTWPSGVYSDGGIISYTWKSDFQNGTTEFVFDSNGDIIHDPDGNAQAQVKNFTSLDLSKVFTLGATWIGSTQWSQFIEHIYTLTVNAPQSINQFGQLSDTLTAQLKDEFDDSIWTAYATDEFEPGANVQIEKQLQLPELDNIFRTEVAIAQTEILGSHRGTQVVTQLYVQPYLELSHTVEINSNKVHAKGKVQRIVHTLDMTDGKDNQTEVTLAIFQAQGSGSTDQNIPPTVIQDSVNLSGGTITLGNSYGVDPKKYSGNGMVGNSKQTVFGNLTTYNEEFRVDTPPIPDNLRSQRTLTRSKGYNLAIPNDLLEIFD